MMMHSNPPAATGQEVTMIDGLIRITTNERLTRAAHWTVFSLGAASLAFAIFATAATAL
jgi:hypothetical protein